MHVALVTFCPKSDQNAAAALKKLEEGSVSRGNRVDLINGLDDSGNVRLTIYDYIAVVVRSPGILSSKMPTRIKEYLSLSGTVSGKKGCALVLQKGFMSAKSCRNLMTVMESEGIKLDYSEVVRNPDHAAFVGKKIG